MRGDGPAHGAGGGEAYSRALFDAVPSPVLIVDGDVRILDYNAAGAGLLGPDRTVHLLKRGGEAMGCLHSLEHPEGCGRSESCKGCVVRDSVGEVLRGGAAFRRRVTLATRSAPDGAVAEAELLVTAAPFVHEGTTLVLLILEDVTELALLRRIVPICSHCKKIRNDRDYWESVEGYLRKHTHLEFSHSICETCLKEHYGDVLGGKV